MDCSPPGSSVHGILQARILEWVTIPLYMGSSQPRDGTGVSYFFHSAGKFFFYWANRVSPKGVLPSCLEIKSQSPVWQAGIVTIILTRQEKAMASHSSTLAWKIPWRRSLVGYSPWGHEELDMTEWLHFDFSLSCIGEGNGNPLQCSCLENPRDGGAWWAPIYGVTQSWTGLKRLSSSSSSSILTRMA